MVLVCIVFIICVALYTHSPHYVLEYGAKPYITEAEEFFRQNSEQLKLLTEIVRDNNEFIRYSFHYPQYNKQVIPADIEAVLLELERNTEKDYVVDIYKKNIDIFIESDTHLQVSLIYSVPPSDHLYENQRKYDFGEGWILYTLYVLRG